MYSDWLAELARFSSNKVVLLDPENKHEYTYQELNDRAERLASYFKQAGVEFGDRIALHAPNHISHFDFFFACAKIGAIFVPLNWRLVTNELREIIEDCEPKLIARSNNRADNLPEDFEYFINVETEDYEELLDRQKAANFHREGVDMESIAILMYTGGTTGRPKGVMISHRHIWANCKNTKLGWALNQTDRTITFSPMFHVAGIAGLVLPLLWVGGQVVLMRTFEPDLVIPYIRLFQPTIFFMVPSMFYSIMHKKEFTKESFSSVRLMVSGGAPMNQEVHERIRAIGLPVINSFGMSEVGSNNFYIHPMDSYQKRDAVGKPLPYVEAKIVDPENPEIELVAGETGELVLSGEHTFSGYWKLPEETKNTLKGNQVYTGDLAKIDEDGDFRIVGRKKELIITGGENVYPSEVEQVLLNFEPIKDITVIGYENVHWGESVGAAVILESGEDQDQALEAIAKYSRENLANYKVPKHYIFIDEFPMTAVGKIDKKSLSRMIGEDDGAH